MVVMSKLTGDETEITTEGCGAEDTTVPIRQFHNKPNTFAPSGFSIMPGTTECKTFPMVPWKDAINSKFPYYLSIHRNRLGLFERIRTAVDLFVNTHVSSMGLVSPEHPHDVKQKRENRTLGIPETLLNLFYEWVAIQIPGHFTNPEQGMSSVRKLHEVTSSVDVNMEQVVAVAAEGDVNANFTSNANVERTNTKKKDAPIFFVNSKGVKIFRYSHILTVMLNGYMYLPKEARAAFKKGVKEFLEYHMASDVTSSLIYSESKKQNTYGIPENFIDIFTEWAYRELSKCFPSHPIALPEAVKRKLKSS
ncbi:hypothetical protein HDU67_003499 [Dinochytrium kinnereticum]|nr:hypothetical protein HDU67_003499 [Dinochytrium kinnereticum]